MDSPKRCPIWRSVGKLARKAGLRVHETGDSAFDETFSVTADDPATAGKILTDAVRAWLVSDPRSEDTPIRVVGDEVVTWRPGPLELQDVQPRADFLCHLLDRAGL